MMRAKTLSCTVEVLTNRSEIHHLITTLSHPGFLNLDAAARTTFALTLTSRTHRLDMNAPGIFGTGMSIVDLGNEYVWMHHAERLFVTLPKETLPRTDFTSALNSVSNIPNEQSKKNCSWEQFNDSRIRSHFSANGHVWRHEIEYEPGGDPELNRRLLEVLIGDLGFHQSFGYPIADLLDSLLTLGTPKSLDLLVARSEEGPFVAASTTKISHLAIKESDDSTFAIPRGYKNVTKWRETANQEKGAGAQSKLTPIYYSSERMRGARNQSSHLRHRIPGVDPHRPRGEDESKFPGTFVETSPAGTTAAVGLRVEDQLLKDIVSVVNQGVVSFHNFSGQNGFVQIDWLKQLRADVASRGSNELGTFLFRLLHDVDFPDHVPGHPYVAPTNPDWERFLGRGLLDRQALREARSLVLSSTYPNEIVQQLSPSMQARMAFFGTNWNGLPDGIKLRLAYELVERDYGRLILAYPEIFEPSDPVLGLVNIRLENIQWNLAFPPVPSPQGNPPPPRAATLLSLSTRTDGAILGTLNLGTLALTGTLVRWPNATYFYVLGATALVALFIPALWWVLPLLVNVGLFVALDQADMKIEAGPITASLSITFPAGSSGALKPTTTLSLDAPLSITTISYVPTGIHQIVDAVASVILGAGGVAVELLESAISNEITRKVQQTLGEGFPGNLLGPDILITGGDTRGASPSASAPGHIYLEAQLGQPSVSPEQINRVAVNLDMYGEQSADIGRVTAAAPGRHYFSISISENAVNQMLAVRWYRGLYRMVLSTADISAIRTLAQAPIPSNQYGDLLVQPNAAPIVEYAKGLPGGQQAYANWKIPAGMVRVVGSGSSVFEIDFRSEIPAQIVLGSASSSPNFIGFNAGFNQAIDVLLDLNNIAIDVSEIREVKTVLVTRTTIEIGANGKPKRIVVAEEVDQVTVHPITAQQAALHVPFVREAIKRGFDTWSDRKAPRRNGVAAQNIPADSLDKQIYTLDGNTDPDLLPTNPVITVPTRLGIGGGIWHAHLFPFGLAMSVLEGTLALSEQNARTAEVIIKGMKDPVKELDG